MENSSPTFPWVLNTLIAPLPVLRWVVSAAWKGLVGNNVVSNPHSPPTRTLVTEHVALLHRCAVEFNTPATEEPSNVQTGILLNSLFDRYYFPRYRGAPPADPDPVFDFLYQVVDSDRTHGLPPVLRTPGGGLEAIVVLCMPLSIEMDDRPPFILFALKFLVHLKNIWDAKKEQRLAGELVSPMPWSVSSRRLEDERFVPVQCE